MDTINEECEIKVIDEFLTKYRGSHQGVPTSKHGYYTLRYFWK